MWMYAVKIEFSLIATINLSVCVESHVRMIIRNFCCALLPNDAVPLEVADHISQPIKVELTVMVSRVGEMQPSSLHSE
jgi:hypothetical protein